MRKRQIEDKSCKENKQQLGQMKRGGADAKGNTKVAASSLIRISNRTNLRWQQRACQIRSWPSRAENLPVLGAKSRNSSSQTASWGLCVYMSVSMCAITAACKPSSSPLITAARLFPACPPWDVTLPLNEKWQLKHSLKALQIKTCWQGWRSAVHHGAGAREVRGHRNCLICPLGMESGVKVMMAVLRPSTSG